MFLQCKSVKKDAQFGKYYYNVNQIYESYDIHNKINAITHVISMLDLKQIQI